MLEVMNQLQEFNEIRIKIRKVEVEIEEEENEVKATKEKRDDLDMDVGLLEEHREDLQDKLAGLVKDLEALTNEPSGSNANAAKVSS